MKNKQASQRLVQWKIVVEHIKEDAATLPYLSEEVGHLERLLEQAEKLVTQREAKKAEGRQLGTSLHDISREGDRIRSQIRAILNGKLGFSDDRLLRYGFDPKPSPPRRRPRPAEPVVSSPAPAPAGSQPPAARAAVPEP